jgi:O-antigen/teichoic acid export membrane protein
VRPLRAMTARRQPSLLRNTFAQSAPLMLGYVFSFVSAPVIVSGLGLRQFGIWALTGALAQYAALFDLGSGPTISRFIAAHEDDRRTCGEYVGIGMISGACVTAIMLAASLLAAGPLSHALGGISTADMRIVLLSSAVLYFGATVGNVVATYPIGMRRMGPPNLGLAIGLSVNFVASVGSIALGADLEGYAIANAAAGLVSAVVIAVLVFRAEGRIPVAWPSRTRAMSFLTYTLKSQVVQWTALINFQTDKIVIAFAVGPSAAGAYDLANRVALAAREVGVYPLGALLPTLTADHNRLGIEKIRERYGRLTEVTVALGFPSLVLTAAIAPLLLGAWLSFVPPYSTAVLAVLCLAYVASASSGVGYVVGAAAGDPGVAARAATGTAIANLLLTVALAPLFGVWGVLAGTMVALTGGSLAQVVMVHRRFGLSLRSYLDAVVPTLRICVLLAAPGAIIAYSGLVQGRVLEAVVVAVISLVYGLLYARWAVCAERVPETVGRWLSRFVPLIPPPAPVAPPPQAAATANPSPPNLLDEPQFRHESGVSRP